jgi:putative membrane protein
MRPDRTAYRIAHGGDEAMMNGWDGADWIWMTFMMIAFWGGLAAVVVFAIKGFGRSRPSPDTQTPDARTILETRFAKGDISEEEFEDRKKTLGLVGGLNRQDDGKVAGAR